MVTNLTRTQIDRLGDRLKKGIISEADLRLLDSYRRSFSEAYEVVVEIIRRDLALEPTGRPAKSTTSISDKLRRESIRLSQIQDIAGCRLIVPDFAGQESVVQSLKNLFEHTTVIDRREKPSHGYRAVHVVANCRGKTIEVQVRTSLQQGWAELSEKISDVVNPAIKYGGGDETIQAALTGMSGLISDLESLETQVATAAAKLSSQDNFMDDEKQEVDSAQEEIDSLRQYIFTRLRNIIEKVEESKGGTDGISD